MSLAAVAAMTGAVLAFGVTPAHALATCPNGHICFYESFNYIGDGKYLPAGTMSDQTDALLKHPTSVTAELDKKKRQLYVDGKIRDFRNSHYWNGTGLNDSISLVVNNSDHCLLMYGNGNFDWDKNFHPYEGIQIGPYTSKAMAGAFLGDDNDKLSSALTLAGTSAFCTLTPPDTYLILQHS